MNDTHTPDLTLGFGHLEDAVDRCRCIVPEGRVLKVVGLIAEGYGIGLSIGSLCRLKDNGVDILAEVVGFNEDRVLLMPYGNITGLKPGCKILLVDNSPKAEVGDALLGRVLDGMGEPLDGKGPLLTDQQYPLYGKHINPLDRVPIKEKMDVGIAAINSR